MKRIIAVLALGLCVGCGTQKQSTTTTNPPPPPPPPVGNGLVGAYSGSVTGTNFAGTAGFVMMICYDNSSGPCEASGGTLTVENATISAPCSANSGAGVPTGIPITINGNQFSASGSGNDEQLGNWTFSINGTMSNTTGIPEIGQTTSGNVTFSTGSCGSPASPWTATFSAQLTTL
jgi:hypothetical protein